MRSFAACVTCEPIPPRRHRPVTRSAAPGREPPGIPALADYWRALLRDGWTPNDRHDTPWGAAQGYANASCGAGRGRDAFVRDLSDERNGLHAALRYREDGTRRTWNDFLSRLDDAWSNAETWTLDHPTVRSRTEAHQRLGEIRDAVNCHTWTGRTALRDRAVMLALLRIGDSMGSLTPRVSIRTICADTSYGSVQTVHRAISALRDAGWITTDRADATPQTPTTYNLLTPARAVTQVNRSMVYLPVEACSPVSQPPDPPTDLAVVLSPHAAAVWDALPSGPGVDVPTVAGRAGVHRRTVYRWLPRLEKLGLAARDGHGGWVRGPESPDVVAKDLGVEAKVQRRADRHALEREGFHGWYAARAEAVAQARRAAQVREAKRPKRELPSRPSTTPPTVRKRGPETRAGAVDPEGWARLIEKRFPEC